MKIEGLERQAGEHCETTALGVLLSSLGIVLSEPMRFGIGEGFGFLYWDAKALEFPMVLGRSRPLEVSTALARNLGLQLAVQETTSERKAWDILARELESGVPVGLKLDSYYLDYFPERFHFAAHVVAAWGFDEDVVHLVDTKGAGGCVSAGRESLRRARAARGPMASKNLSFTLRKRGTRRPVEAAVRRALRQTAERYLSPPIRNVSHRGIALLARRMPRWLERTSAPERHLAQTAMLMENGGTGGSLFRNLYRDFLREARELLADVRVSEAAEQIAESAIRWRQVSELIAEAGRSVRVDPLRAAADLLPGIAELEREGMETLLAA
jgi:hypothetical protein